MHSGDWKLLRLFHDGDDDEDGKKHGYRLYHLKTDIGESNNLADQEPERVAAMDAKIEAFLKDCQAVVPKPNPAYTGKNATDTGWSNSKDCVLKTDGGKLIVKSQGRDPHFRCVLAKPIDAGELVMVARIKTNVAGSIEIRWQEKGVQPAYHKDRLIRSVPIDADGWQEVKIAFTADHPVTTFRVDPAVGSRVLEIDDWVITRNGSEVAKWDFE